MTNKWLVLVAVAALAISCGGGSDSDENGGGTVPLTSDGEAVSTAVTGTCSGSVNGTNNAMKAASGENISSERRVREGIATYVLRRALDQISHPSNRLEKTVEITQDGNNFAVTFTDEVVENDEGAGTITLSGALALSLTDQEENEVEYTYAGDILAVIAGWGTSVTVDSTTYDEVISGTWTLSYSGTTTTDMQTGASTIDFAISVTGEEIEVTGDASGTASINIAVAASGPENNMTTICTGSVTATTSEGTQTCNISSDCESCS